MNGPLFFETAILMLAAFLVGAVTGTLARRIAARRQATGQPGVPGAATETVGSPLVIAPTIAPVAGRQGARTPAERLAAAAGREPPAAHGPAAQQPSTGVSSAAEALALLAGSAPSSAPPPAPSSDGASAAADDDDPGAVVDAAGASDAEHASVGNEPAGSTSIGAEPPTASGPTDDDRPAGEPGEAGGELNTPATDTSLEKGDEAPVAVSADSPQQGAVLEAEEDGTTRLAESPDGAALPDVVLGDEPEEAGRADLPDLEVAAMQAIEGGWSPPSAPVTPPRRVEHPEHTAASLPLAEDEPPASDAAVSAKEVLSGDEEGKAQPLSNTAPAVSESDAERQDSARVAAATEPPSSTPDLQETEDEQRLESALSSARTAVAAAAGAAAEAVEKARAADSAGSVSEDSSDLKERSA